MKNLKELIYIIPILIIVIPTSCEKSPTETVVEIHTDTVSDISYNSCLAYGTIVSVGDKGFSNHGFFWAESENSRTNSHIELGQTFEKGSLSAVIDGLKPDTRYIVRMYALSEQGEYYGEKKEFTTRKGSTPSVITYLPDSISKTSATLGGSVTDNGGYEIIEKGIYIGTTPGLDTLGTKVKIGNGEGDFFKTISNLDFGKTYYFIAYATNVKGSSFGEELNFNTDAELPHLTTSDATEVTGASAMSGGSISNNGGMPILSRGVCWSLEQNPIISDSKTVDGTGIGDFSSRITGLDTNTPYYARAYATNSVGTAYGNQITFITTDGLPSLTTTEISEINGSSALGGGEVTDDGGLPVTQRGVCWSTQQNPDTDDSKSINGNNTGSFNSELTTLEANTPYYVRAFATNAAGTKYGNQVSFVTTDGLPTVSTLLVSDIELSNAKGGGDVVKDGGFVVTARGVCWSLEQNPTLDDNYSTDGTNTGTYTSTISDLIIDTIYYVRAYGTNIQGTAYGEQVAFHTKLIDNEGNAYAIVMIGDQVWMAENLKVSKYNDGTSLSYITDQVNWRNAWAPGFSDGTARAYCYYDNDPNNKDIYGVIYNGYAVNYDNLCPSGWLVPGTNEWTALIDYLGDASFVGGELKEAGTSHWNQPNTGANNNSGYNALPGGRRGGFGDGLFYELGDKAYLWSRSHIGIDWKNPTYKAILSSNNSSIDISTTSDGRSGNYVRCIKD